MEKSWAYTSKASSDHVLALLYGLAAVDGGGEASGSWFRGGFLCHEFVFGKLLFAVFRLAEERSPSQSDFRVNFQSGSFKMPGGWPLGRGAVTLQYSIEYTLLNGTNFLCRFHDVKIVLPSKIKVEFALEFIPKKKKSFFSSTGVHCLFFFFFYPSKIKDLIIIWS